MAMPHPRYNPGSPRDLDVPFRAFARIVPYEGKPQEYYFDMERLANQVESDLTGAAANSAGETINIATPVAFTPQFGNHTARLTVVGFHRADAVAKKDRTDATFDHDNSTVSGQVGGANMARTDPDLVTDEGVASLKAYLENASAVLDGAIFKIEYAGAIYGEDGRTFPS
jgi:hypothetical protein